MTGTSWHIAWMLQRDIADVIQAQFGFEASSNYSVGEKLQQPRQCHFLARLVNFVTAPYRSTGPVALENKYADKCDQGLNTRKTT